MRTIAEILHSYEVLDSEGRHINGTDKHGPNHQYGDAYESLFLGSSFDISKDAMVMFHGCPCRTMRNAVKLVMEVGVADGSCLLAWREVFPNATIVGMDIHTADKVCGRGPIERIQFVHGDQRLQHHCEIAAQGRMFDLIIDDATHLLEDTLRTLYFLWPYVKPGGIYIVEEWPGIDRNRICSLWPQAGLIGTTGPFGGVEPLVVFRKPL